MRVFYYTIYYFLVYLIFLIKITVGEEILKQSSPTNFFLFCQYNRQFIRGPPSFQIIKIWKEKNMKGPKRRKYKDTPYTLFFDENNQIYFIIFKDVKGIIN